ncbi:MAG: HPr Serine kinase C-terminal domain [Actinomycetota bacterium]|nr:HPr Serine kinase C-terminal domain [Actinomycetota bacterium]
MFGPMPDHDGPYAAEIIFQERAPAVPDRQADEVYGPISLWRDGNELSLDSGGPLRAHATPSRVVLGGALDGGQLGAMLLRRIVHHVIAHVLSLSGRLVAHGAAVGRGGDAVLLLGSSGSGKSTSAYLASRGGWSLLADDLVVVRRTASGVEAVGVHRAIAVPPDIADDDAADIEHDLRDRRRPDLVLDGRPHRLAAVAMVEHGTAQGSVEATTGLVVASAFIGSTPAAGNVVVAAEALRTAGVISRLPCFRLRLADSAAERRRATAELFQQIAERADLAT